MLSKKSIYFMTVIEEKGFVKATNKLYISQPAISKMVSQYEDELDMVLIDRNSSPISLTKEGEIIYQALKKSKWIINKAIQEANNLVEKKKNLLDFGMLNGWGLQYLPSDTLKNISKHYPEIQINIQQFNYRELNHKLLNDEIDIILTLRGEILDDENILCTTAYCADLYLYISKNHELASKPNLLNSDETLNVYVMDTDASLISYDLMLSVIKNFKLDINLYTLPNVDSLYTAVDQLRGGAFTLTGSRIIEDMSYKVYNTNNKVEVVYAWNKNSKNENVKYFINLVKENP